MPERRTTIIAFSGEYDKLVAAFTIANGAAAAGDEVTVFFTFWGLSALRRDARTGPGGAGPRGGRLQRAMARALPRGTSKLPTSRFNLAGAGPRAMRAIMRTRGIADLDELIALAREQGVRLVACTTSMDILGLTAQDLIEPLEYAGVAGYLEHARDAGVNLFV